MLDTDTLIYFVKKHPESVANRMDALSESDTLCMSFVSYAELLHGAEGSQYRAQAVQSVLRLTQNVDVLFPQGQSGQAVCQQYASHKLALKRQGRPIGNNDLWIAAHALAESAVLVTNNVREFARIDGLVTENWVA